MNLLKSLYGLKQGPKNCHGTIDTFLVGIGFKAYQSDPRVYVFHGTTPVWKGRAVRTDDHPHLLSGLRTTDGQKHG